MDIIAGTCILLLKFPWHVDFVMKDAVSLSYPVIYRYDINGPIKEYAMPKGSLWNLAYVKKNAVKVIKCPKSYKEVIK